LFDEHDEGLMEVTVSVGGGYEERLCMSTNFCRIAPAQRRCTHSVEGFLPAIHKSPTSVTMQDFDG
jgi:hypothetical protein